MKYATILFTFLCLIAATVTALPSPIHLRKPTKIQAQSVNTTLDDDFWADEPVLSRDFEEAYDISERNFADATLEPRKGGGGGGGAEAAEMVVEGVIAIVNAIKGQIQKDKDMRGEWTSTMVGQWRAKYPKWNFVFCHTKHKFEPKQGTPHGHRHQELKVGFGKTIGYEIYWFKEGTFRRIGDGGYLNWSYSGNVKRTSDGGKFLEFGAP